MVSCAGEPLWDVAAAVVQLMPIRHLNMLTNAGARPIFMHHACWQSGKQANMQAGNQAGSRAGR